MVECVARARALVLLAGILCFVSARAATLTVDTVADPSVADGACSLREAITSINAGADSGDCAASGAYGTSDTIGFNISGSGVRTIALASSLPAIAKPMTINGFSQPGASANTNGPGLGSNATLLIEIDATNVGNGADTGALTVGPGGGGTAIQGLVINRYVVNGIALVNSTGGNVVRGNYIGVNAAGTAALTGVNSSAGIEIRGFNGFAEDNDTIGGTNPADRNVIAGNNTSGQINFPSGTQTGHTIQGNFIGTNAAGTASLSIATCGSSAQAGIRVGAGTANVTIGALASGGRNLISGNCARGLSLGGPDSAITGNTIEGNYIGTDVTGTLALGNQGEAIELFGVGSTTIQSNVISAAINTASNGTGIDVNGVTGSTSISSNMIGTDAGGTANLGNQGSGIVITNTNGVAINGNVIAFNGCCQLGGQPGVFVASGTGNTIVANSIFSNQTLGIDLAPLGVNANDAGDGDAGANNGQNYPVITSAVTGGGNVTVQGTLNSAANSAYRIDLYSNAACDGSGNGEGQTFLTAFVINTDGSGNASFNDTTPLSGGSVITATATLQVGASFTDTSEFSACLAASGAPTATTTSLVSSLNPSTFGQSVTFTATVTGSSPTGTVQFEDNGTNLGSPVTLSGGVATLTTSSLGVGTHPITAVYGGDSGNLGSTSNTVDQVVNPASTATTLVSSLNPSSFGQLVSFTATVSGGSSPTGTVQFEDNGANLGAPAALIGGVAQISTSGLSVGTHPITAVYSGDTNNATSTSNTVDQVVNGAGPPPPPPATTVTPIPTLDPWGLIVAAALLLLTGLASFVRRRR